MAIKRVIDTGFWTDDKVVDLFSPEDKLFMLYILTNPHTTQLGIYKINKKIMAFELGYSVDTIDVLLDRFENKYNIIVFSKETNEIAIKNYLKYSIIKGGKPVEDCLTKELNDVKDTNLIKFIFNNIKDYENINETVKKIIDEYKLNNNDNDNDNDNEVSYHDTLDDTSNNKKKSFIAPTLEDVEEYCRSRNNNVDAKTFYDYYSVNDWKDKDGKKISSWKQKVITWEKHKTEQLTNEERRIKEWREAGEKFLRGE